MARDRSWTRTIGWIVYVLVVAVLIVAGYMRSREARGSQDEWAVAVEAYFTDARLVADEYLDAGERVETLLDAMVAGTLSSADAEEAEDALTKMRVTRMDWLALSPPVELVDAHKGVGEAMQLDYEAGRELYAAYTADDVGGMRLALAKYRDAQALVDQAIEDLEEWYQENEQVISRYVD